jgi:hypothetical protein
MDIAELSPDTRRWSVMRCCAENLAQLARREAGYTRADSPSCGPLLAATAAGVFAGAVEAGDLMRRIEVLAPYLANRAINGAVAKLALPPQRLR